MLGVVLAISGFVVALVMVDGSHFTNVHSWFGITTLSFSIIAPSLGLVAHLVYDETRESVPIWPDQIHCK